MSPYQDTTTMVELCPSIWEQGRGGKGKGGMEQLQEGAGKSKRHSQQTCTGKSPLIP